MLKDLDKKIKILHIVSVKSVLFFPEPKPALKRKLPANFKADVVIQPTRNINGKIPKLQLSAMNGPVMAHSLDQSKSSPTDLGIHLTTNIDSQLKNGNEKEPMESFANLSPGSQTSIFDFDLSPPRTSTTSKTPPKATAPASIFDIDEEALKPTPKFVADQEASKASTSIPPTVTPQTDSNSSGPFGETSVRVPSLDTIKVPGGVVAKIDFQFSGNELQVKSILPVAQPLLPSKILPVVTNVQVVSQIAPQYNTWSDRQWSKKATLELETNARLRNQDWKNRIQQMHTSPVRTKDNVDLEKMTKFFLSEPNKIRFKTVQTKPVKVPKPQPEIQRSSARLQSKKSLQSTSVFSDEMSWEGGKTIFGSGDALSVRQTRKIR